MKKTGALFGLAGSLLIGAVVLDLWPTSGSKTPTPTPMPPTPPPSTLPPTPTAQPGASAVLGEVVTMNAALSQSHVLAGANNELFLRANLDAKDVGVSERPAMAIAVVIDRSGSMAGEKMEKAREAAKGLVDRLDTRDKISIVSYATDYTVDLPLTAVSSGHRSRIHHLIDQIFDGGGTNLSGGLHAGLKQLRRASAEGLLSRVILLSDGNANQGITDPRALARIAQTARLRGITISTLGVGVDFNEDLMTGIAESAGGAYYYARDGQAIASALESEFKGLVRIAARQVEVGLELAEGVVIKEVYGYRTEVRRGRVVVPVGDMAGNQRRQVLIRLGVPGNGEGLRNVAKITLAYSESQGAEREYHGALSGVSTRDQGSVASSQQQEILESIETVLAAQARKNAVTEFSSGNKNDAKRRLQKQIRRTRKKASALGSAVLQQQAEELESALGNMDSYDSSSFKGKDFVKSEKLRARQLSVEY